MGQHRLTEAAAEPQTADASTDPCRHGPTAWWPTGADGERTVASPGACLRDGGPGEVAGDQVARLLLLQRGLDLAAHLPGDGTAGAEPAARGGADGAGDVPAEHDTVSLPPRDRLGDGGEQGDRVGVQRTAVQLL